jgi:hypothetical protein
MPTKTTAKKVPAKKAAPEAPAGAITASTIAEATHEPANRPESFKSLKSNELHYAAEIFAVEHEDLPDEVVLANLAADGITWNAYARQMKLPGWENLPEVEAEPVDTYEDEEGDEDMSQEVITALPLGKLDEGKYLIKFIGDNWYFERGRYSFSTDKPYALMNAQDAQSALVEEPTKFRQAFPQELEDYYS